MKAGSLQGWRSRVLCGLLVVVALFGGIALLPGKLEGVYGGHISCLCGSVHLADYRQGKVILHSFSHPPAEIICRYETDENNVSTVYWLASIEGESDTAIMKVYPHLLITRFEKVEDGSVSWEWKRPILGNTRRTIRQQEITSRMVLRNRATVTTYYDNSLNPVRTETKYPRSTPKKSR